MDDMPPAVPPTNVPIPPPEQQGNGQAIASMVLGILSFVFCGPLFSVPAVILGHMSLGKIKRGAMSQESRGFALAGTFLGWTNIVLFVLVVAFYIGLIVFASNAGRVSPFIYVK